MTGLCMGTLSEEASVVVLVVLSAVLLILAGRRRAGVRWWCLAGMAGTVTGTLVLYTSPGARIRRERFDTDGLSFLAPDSLLGSLRGFGHILGTLLTTWAYLGAVAAGVLLGLLIRGPGGRRVVLPRRWPLLSCAGVLAFLVSGYLCTVVAYPAFGASVMTSSRIWNDFLLLYVAELVGAARWWDSPWVCACGAPVRCRRPVRRCVPSCASRSPSRWVSSNATCTPGR